MYCIRCGRILESGSKFCMYCGAPAVEAAQEQKQGKAEPTLVEVREFDRKFPKERSAVKIPEDFFSRSLDLEEKPGGGMEIHIPESYFNTSYIPVRPDLSFQNDVPEETVRIVMKKGGEEWQEHRDVSVDVSPVFGDGITEDTIIVRPEDDRDIKIVGDVKDIGRQRQPKEPPAEEAPVQQTQPEEILIEDTAVLSREDIRQAMQPEQPPAEEAPVQQTQPEEILIEDTAVLSREDIRQAMQPEEPPAEEAPVQQTQPEEILIEDTAVLSRDDIRQAMQSEEPPAEEEAVEQAPVEPLVPSMEESSAQPPEPQEILIEDTAVIDRDELRRALAAEPVAESLHEPAQDVQPKEAEPTAPKEPEEHMNNTTDTRETGPITQADEVTIPEEIAEMEYVASPEKKPVRRYEEHKPWAPDPRYHNQEPVEPAPQSLIGWKGMLVVFILVFLLLAASVGIVISVFNGESDIPQGSAEAVAAEILYNK